MDCDFMMLEGVTSLKFGITSQPMMCQFTAILYYLIDGKFHARCCFHPPHAREGSNDYYNTGVDAQEYEITEDEFKTYEVLEC